MSYDPNWAHGDYEAECVECLEPTTDHYTLRSGASSDWARDEDGVTITLCAPCYRGDGDSSNPDVRTVRDYHASRAKED